MSEIDKTILQNLAKNDAYARRVLPFLRQEYFLRVPYKILFNEIKSFFNSYNNPPTKEALVIEVSSKNLEEKHHNDVMELVDSIYEEFEKPEDSWLDERTEKFCKDKALYNAIMESIHIIDGKSKDFTPNAIPEILSNALSVSFDTNIGHDYILDADCRYDFYHNLEARMPFDLSQFNSITGGGAFKKSLNIVLAGTNVGKSMFLCHHAAACLSQHKNVLYITCEMAEERIAERIDANLMDIPLDELVTLPKDIYKKKIDRLKTTIKGKLIIKEYPTSTASVTNFRHLITELRLKKKFVPEVIFIDYLNICTSSRINMNSNTGGSYAYIKAIAEEFRGLAVENDLSLWTATQVNRSGFTNTDLGLEDTSESFGLPMTADFMFALITTEELDKLNQMLVKQLKNRYNDKSKNSKFMIGVNRSKMRFYDLENTAQNIIVDDNQPQKPSTKSKFGRTTDWKFN